MYHIVESDKSFEDAARDLESAVVANQFGVLHIHDLAATLRSKGLKFEGECRVFEVCNPHQAERILSRDLRVNMALPCRISVYTDEGATKLGLIKPEEMLKPLSDNAEIASIATEVQATMLKMLDEAR